MKATLVIRPSVVSMLVFALAGLPLLAQETVSQPAATDGHQLLKKFVGKWELKNKGSMGEGQPEMEATSVMNAKMLGDLWVLCDIEGDVDGTVYRAMQTIGYDPDKKKFVGTWVDSITPHLWVYEGWLDESGTKLTLEAKGPNMMAGGEITKFRDVYEFKDDDQIVATSSMLLDDGKWLTFMNGIGKRKQN